MLQIIPQKLRHRFTAGIVRYRSLPCTRVLSMECATFPRYNDGVFLWMIFFRERNVEHYSVKLSIDPWVHVFMMSLQNLYAYLPRSIHYFTPRMPCPQSLWRVVRSFSVIAFFLVFHEQIRIWYILPLLICKKQKQNHNMIDVHVYM